MESIEFNMNFINLLYAIYQPVSDLHQRQGWGWGGYICIVLLEERCFNRSLIKQELSMKEMHASKGITQSMFQKNGWNHWQDIYYLNITLTGHKKNV